MAEKPEDNWFSEPDVPASRDGIHEPIEDDWLITDAQPSRSGSLLDLRNLATARVVVPVVAFVALLIALLAAAGVFNGATPHTAAPTVTATTPSAAPTTTATTARPAAKPPTSTLKPGDTGTQVKVLQRALASLGYSAGAVDGYYGTQTTQALAAFQHAHGLTADGILGSKTLQALTLALAP